MCNCQRIHQIVLHLMTFDASQLHVETFILNRKNVILCYFLQTHVLLKQRELYFPFCTVLIERRNCMMLDNLCFNKSVVFVHGENIFTPFTCNLRGVYIL